MPHTTFSSFLEQFSSEGEALAWSRPLHTTAWWSHGTAARAGIGLLVKNKFLAHFDQSLTQWIEVVPGRAAILRLKGPQGALDIHAVYFATGKSTILQTVTESDQSQSEHSNIRRQRQSMRCRMANHCLPQNTCLTVMAGDFNWVTMPQDRVSLTSAQFSTTDDSKDEQHWKTAVAQPIGLHELHQPLHTHSSAQARSRLDRVYWNQHFAEQLDRTLTCTTLEWQPSLSAHRAISFARKTPEFQDFATKPIPTHVIDRPDWNTRVSARYRTLHTSEDSPSGLKKTCSHAHFHQTSFHGDRSRKLPPE